MYRTLSAAAVLATVVAATAPAFASDITVSLVGKDPAAARAEIAKAAGLACADAYAGAPYDVHSIAVCAEAADADALAQAGLAPAEKLASAETPSVTQVASR